MSMKLLPAAVNPVDPSQVADLSNDVSNSLVPVAQRAITMQADQSSIVPSADTFTWSSSARPSRTNWIDATPVDEDDSQSDATGSAAAEYVSGWSGSYPIERTAVAYYLFYAAAPANGNGQLINVYA
jgi:hypothetical protein